MLKWPEHSKRYGTEDSYRIGMEWLKGCEVVEDWGCGPAYSKNYRVGKYIGVDGTEGFCDKQAALESYTSEVEGIFMRHVLEHNLSWKPILENALKSFTERMSLIFFTPWAKETYVVHEWKGIPFISFKKEEILELINPYLKKEVTVPHKKGLTDTVFCLQKQNYGDDGNRSSINTKQ
jgi:hypothetical protein